MVDRDLSLRKAIDKRCDFIVSLKVEQRDAVRWTRCPRCLIYGIREEFDFPSLCNSGRNGTRAISNSVSPLSLFSFPREILRILLTRGLRWGVEADVGRPLLDFRLIITRDFDLYFFNLA